MEVTVQIESLPEEGQFRASCGEPMPASVVGNTREEALLGLRGLLAKRLLSGVEIVRMTIPEPKKRTGPILPDDELTRQWLAEIAENRKLADANPAPWETVL